MGTPRAEAWDPPVASGHGRSHGELVWTQGEVTKSDHGFTPPPTPNPGKFLIHKKELRLLRKKKKSKLYQ